MRKPQGYSYTTFDPALGEAGFRPLLPITLKYQDVSQAQCSAWQKWRSLANHALGGNEDNGFYLLQEGGNHSIYTNKREGTIHELPLPF